MLFVLIIMSYTELSPHRFSGEESCVTEWTCLAGIVALIGGLGLDLHLSRLKSNASEENMGYVSGEVIAEKFTEGMDVKGGVFDKIPVRSPHKDLYEMIVKTDNGKQFIYTAYGKTARAMDMRYDVSSKIDLLPNRRFLGSAEYGEWRTPVQVDEIPGDAK